MSDINYITHHGVKGMKWGVRNDYKPKGRKSSSKQESTEDSRKKKGLSTNQKRAIIIGASAVAAVAATYGTYRLYKSGKLDKAISFGKEKVDALLKKNNFGDTKVKDLTADKARFKASMEAGEWGGRAFKIKKLGRVESVEEAISRVNTTGSHNNCYNCVVATVGRLCGFDVTAKGDTQGGRGMSFDDICRAFKLNPDNDTDVRRVINPSVDKLTSIIGKKYKEGDVGAIGLSWNDAYKKPRGLSEAGHTLNWIVKNGKVQFMDGQANISGERLTSFMSAFLDSGKEASIARFANIADNLDLDMLSKFAN